MHRLEGRRMRRGASGTPACACLPNDAYAQRWRLIRQTLIYLQPLVLPYQSCLYHSVPLCNNADTALCVLMLVAHPLLLCWIRSIDCIGQDQLESSHSTFWIRFWIAQLDHDWIPRLIYDGHQLVSLLYSPHLFEGSWYLIHTFFENPSLIVSEKKEY